MNPIHPGRYTARPEEAFALYLVGMRIHKPHTAAADGAAATAHPSQASLARMAHQEGGRS